MMQFVFSKFVFLIDFTATQTLLMPLVIIALLLDLGLLLVWYWLGVATANHGVTEAARTELYQLLGTAFLAMVIIGVMSLSASLFFTALRSTTLLNPTAIGNPATGLCHKIMTTTSFSMLGTPNSLLSGPSGAVNTFPGLCALVNPSANPTLTEQIDYPLAVVGVIIANLTNQTVANLDNSFVIDAYLGFLANLKPTVGFCAAVPEAIECLFPPEPVPEPGFELRYSFAPFAGFDMLFNSLSVLGTIQVFSLESFVAQLVLLGIFLYVWPYLIFIGLVLRAVFLTRKIGGLFIAVAIAGLIFFPIAYSLEYLALANGIQGPEPGIYGFSAVTVIPQNQISPTTTTHNYEINFFVMPNVKAIAQFYGCWPRAYGGAYGKLSDAEFADITFLLIPFLSLIATVTNLLSSTPSPQNLITSLGLPSYCGPDSALATTFALLNAYGLLGITAYLLPLLNLFIFFTSALGLSGLLGGETQLLGISSLI